MTTTPREELSPWCLSWVRSLPCAGEEPPQDRPARLASALSERGLAVTDALVDADLTVFGLVVDQVCLGIVEALEVRRHVPIDDFPVSPSGAPLAPLSSPRSDPELWCAADGSMFTVLADLGVCEATYDSARHYLECQALQREYLRSRGDRYGFETSVYAGEVAAQALGLPVLAPPTGERCRAWSGAPGVVVEARIEQYLYGTSIGLRGGADVAALLTSLPAEVRSKLGIVKGTVPGPDDAQGTLEQTYDIEYGQILIYRREGAVTAVYRK